ncbi:MAG: VWA domain-containing protein [SAR324 cluster bacterium]|nr:VWA domain-containing protein [SAR324 cluster bacterium]
MQIRISLLFLLLGFLLGILGLETPVSAQGFNFFGSPPKKQAPAAVIVPQPQPQPKLQLQPKPAPPQPKPKPKPKPVVQPKRSISDVLFVMDTSGSMDAPAPGERLSKLASAKKALRYFAKHMREGTRIQFWTFNARIQQQPNSPALKPRSATVIFEPIGPSGSAVRRHLSKVIDQLDTRGGTNLYEALHQAIRSFRSSAYQVPKGAKRRKLVVVLADGQDDDLSPIKLPHVLAAKRKHPQVLIRTIGFGISKSDPLYHTLCQLASNRQSCTVAKDAAQLQRILRSFTDS